MFNQIHKQQADGSTQMAGNANAPSSSPRHPRRRASVLILVVALLVLMALIGTAYISSTRIERYTSNQNSANTEVDLLLQGIVNTVQSDIVTDLFDTSTATPAFKPAQPLTSAPNTYSSVDSAASKVWLADRIPETLTLSAEWTFGAVGEVNPQGWRSISWPLMQSATGSFQFDSPDGGTALALSSTAVQNWNSTTAYALNDKVYYGQTVYHSRVAANLNNFPPSSPAFWDLAAKTAANIVYTPSSKNLNGVQVPTLNGAIAADTDGDGIADAGLWKIPVSPINGITYYAATRIVDNTAAINVNTAWSGTTDFDGAGAAMNTITGLFPSNVGLFELMNPAGSNAQTEMDQINFFRFGSAPFASPVHNDLTDPYADDGNHRKTPSDFQFETQSEELFSQLGRRLDNPGYVLVSTSAAPSQAKAFTFADNVNLAAQFCIANSTVGAPALATYMTNSLSGTLGITSSIANTTPYSAAEASLWFNNNFFFSTPPYNLSANTPYYRPLRSLITTRNPVSVTAPAIYSGVTTVPPNPTAAVSTDMVPYNAPTWLGVGTAPVGTYSVGDWVEWTTPNTSQPKIYLCLQASNTIAPKRPDISPSFWMNVPWTASAAKTNVNTAEFRELWRSFYNTMADHTTNAPQATAHVGQRIFKSSVRQAAAGPAPFALSDTEQMELRAAVAAVNAEGLRSGKDDVISRTINLDDSTASVGPLPNRTRTVTVYSQQKQPYISEVFISTNGAGNADYVAIELHNPYTDRGATATPSPYFDMGALAAAVPGFPMIHLGCAIGIIDRTNRATPTVDITPGWLATNTIVPGGYIILASADPSPVGAVQAQIAAAQAAPNPPTVVVIPQLLTLVAAGGNTSEIILTRTRVATGIGAGTPTLAGPTAPTYQLDPIKQYDETATNPALPPDKQTPFEQFDFNGFAGGLTSRFDYVRPTVNGAANDGLTWRCVYPLAPAAAGAIENYYQPYQGGYMANLPAMVVGDPRYDSSLGAADPVFAPAGGPPLAAALTWPVIQLNAVDWPGPAQATAGGQYLYPYGGFPRLGDILQVPFIGSYRIYAPAAPSTWIPGAVEEVMSVSMDSVYAQDGNPSITAGALDRIPDPGATDGSLTDKADEQIGRFCPLADVNPLVGYAPPVGVGTDDYYWWASRIFDNFTVLSSHDEFFPIVNPQNYAGTALLPPAAVNHADATKPPYITYGIVGAAATATSIEGSLNFSSISGLYNNALVQMLSGAASGQCSAISSYVTGPFPTPPTINLSAALTIAPAPGDLFRIVADPEADSSDQGLININTASWKVLSMLPLARNLAGAIDNVSSAGTGNFHNDRLAQAIVTYRNLNGPFKSIMDLNKVMDSTLVTPNLGFQSGSADPTETNPNIDFRVTGHTTPVDARQGDYSPLEAPVTPTNLYPQVSAAPPVDGVINDFEKTFLAVTRISNLITTRSDSYTCYVLVQGWRNAGTVQATLAAQKRTAFIIDRSSISATNFNPTITHVPTP